MNNKFLFHVLCVLFFVAVFLFPLTSVAIQFEAEDGVLSGTFVVGNDPNASGGKYVHVPEGTGNGTPGSADYTFTITTGGTYRIDANVYADGGTNDSFWVKMNGQPVNGFRWGTQWNTSYALDQIADYDNGLDPYLFELSEGEHTLSFTNREDGTRLDRLELVLVNTAPKLTPIPDQSNTVGENVSLSVSATDANGDTLSYSATGLPSQLTLDSGTGQITGTVTSADTYDVTISVSDGKGGSDGDTFTWEVSEILGLKFEAEQGVLSGTFVVGNDPNASGGKYVHVPEGTGNGTPGSAEYTFNITTAGIYRIDANVYADGGTNDSFWVKMDGQPVNGFRWGTQWNTSYALDQIADYDNGLDPYLFELSEGEHTLSFTNREDGTRLDRLELVLVNTAPPVITYPGDMSDKIKDIRRLIDSLDHSVINWTTLKENGAESLYYVSNQAEFNTTAKLAKPGDVIIVRNGTYTDYELLIDTSGTANVPIVYMAETPHGVTFTGNTRIYISGDHNIIGGFVFRDAHRHGAITLETASDNRFTDNQFFNCGSTDKRRIVSIGNASDRNRFDHNLMDNNLSFGMVIGLPNDSDYSSTSNFRYSVDNRFDHNVFQNISSSNSVRIPLQIGQQTHRKDETRTLVDHNVFRDISTITINSKSNVEYYVNNQFINIGSTAISIRSGDDKYIESNYFENTFEAMRIGGENMVVINNILDNSRDGILIPAWGIFSNGSESTDRPPTGKILVAHNTILNSKDDGIEIGRAWGFGCEGCLMADTPPYELTIMNNIIAGNEGRLINRIALSSGEIKRNLFYSTGRNSIGHEGSEALFGDPLLTDDHTPMNGSIAIGGAIPLADVPLDFTGIMRDATPDIGAVEN